MGKAKAAPSLAVILNLPCRYRGQVIFY